MFIVCKIDGDEIRKQQISSSYVENVSLYFGGPTRDPADGEIRNFYIRPSFNV